MELQALLVVASLCMPSSKADAVYWDIVDVTPTGKILYAPSYFPMKLVEVQYVYRTSAKEDMKIGNFISLPTQVQNVLAKKFRAPECIPVG